MLSNIKSKFLTVSKNVIFLQNEKQSDPVSYEAGSEILDYFQNEWSTIHNISQNNAKKAEEVARHIEDIHSKIKKTENYIDFIVNTISNSNLAMQINGAHEKIEDLLNLCETVERDLIEYERTIDEMEFQNMKKRHNYHLKLYEEKREESLKKMQFQLEQERQEKMEKEELEKNRKMQERQKVFQEAFQNDLELFKILGQIPKLEINKQPSALLEEIQIDYDTEELDQFFEDINP